jgi:hypothetical protein
MHATDYLVHLSNLLMLVAYSVTDILWLRWFAVAAALTNIPYFLVQPTTLWPPVVWGAVFTIINLYQIAPSGVLEPSPGAVTSPCRQSSTILRGFAFQIAAQYSRIARSDENLPARAVLRIDMCVQRSTSFHAALTRSWHAT